MAYKQQTFLSRDQTSKIRVPSWSGSGEGLFLLRFALFLLCLHLVGGAKELSGLSEH